MEVNWLELLAGGMIGLFAALLVVVVVEGFRGPNFKFEAYDTPPDSPNGVLLRFVHVRVTNERRAFLLRFIDETAYLFTAEILFANPTASRPLVEPMKARWPESEDEPATAKDTLRDYRETLPPGSSSSVNVAVKFNGEDECWGFNTRSYQYQPPPSSRWLRDPKKQLDDDRILVVVAVTAQGKTHRSQVFTLHNPDKTVVNFSLT